MPAGCNFVCVNDKCKQYKSGFVITAPWPMGKIELVINSKRVVANNELRDYLIKLKDGGEKFACIQLPNDEEVPVSAYRISLWSDKAKCLYSYPIEISNLDNYDEDIIKANLPTKCKKTGCELRNFDSVILDGIYCPHCEEKMQQNRWFTNAK